MRVLHFIESLRFGGKERQLAELVKGVSADFPEISSHIVVMSEDIQYGVAGLARVELTQLLRRGRFDAGPWLGFDRLRRASAPDIVHSWGSMCSLFAAPSLALARTPFVNGIIRDAPQGLSMGDKHYRRALLTYPFSDAVVGNSIAGLRAYHAPPNKEVCIYNGFDQSRIANLRPPEQVRAELNIRTPFVVGMVATYSDRKDHPTFFGMARAMLATRDDVTFVTIGDGDQAEIYRQQATETEGHFLRILGKRADVEHIINIFDVGVLTSNSARHGEGISNALMEYMALGKPAVATDDGGTRELVLEGQTGLLVPNGDRRALTRVITDLLADANLRAQLGRAGKLRIETEFSIGAMVDRYVSLYQRLLSRQK